jgi:hypothetical protein
MLFGDFAVATATTRSFFGRLGASVCSVDSTANSDVPADRVQGCEGVSKIDGYVADWMQLALPST